MSKYMELKMQIEQMQAQLEEVRKAELASEVEDMKKRIIAFGIKPSDLFSPQELPQATGRRKPDPDTKRPVAYRLGENEWSGTGPMPTWYADALMRGVTEASMRVPGFTLKHPRTEVGANNRKAA